MGPGSNPSPLHLASVDSAAPARWRGDGFEPGPKFDASGVLYAWDFSEAGLLSPPSPLTAPAPPGDAATAPLGHVLVVGLGVMGLGMAVSLARWCQVTGCDVSAERLDEASKHSLPTVAVADMCSILDLVDCVLLVVEKPEQVIAILDAASSSLASRIRPLTVISNTTMSAASAADIQRRILALGSHIRYLEAPISGGPARAFRGELLVSRRPITECSDAVHGVHGAFMEMPRRA